MTMNELLENAKHFLCLTSNNLREALHHSSSVEAIIILSLIKLVNESRIEVDALANARIADAKLNGTSN